MSTLIKTHWLLPERTTRFLLLKWLVVLLAPLLVFSFLWSGETIVNNILLTFFDPSHAIVSYTASQAVESAVFMLILYAVPMALVGYLVAADSGRRSLFALWLDSLFYIIVPLLIIIYTNNLLIGLGLSVIILPLYVLIRKYVRQALHIVSPAPLSNLHTFDASQRALLLTRGKSAGFWFATTFAMITLVADILFALSGPFPTILLVWTIIRTVLFPIMGYLLGWLGGLIALRFVLSDKSDSQTAKEHQLKELSNMRAREEARDLIPNDLPLQSRGASRFYFILLLAAVIFYPVLDPVLFSFGSTGRMNEYGDLGYYVILALGLNIVVGFAGLLDLGYVAFFVIGSYVWAMIGSPQLTLLTGFVTHAASWSWLFWPCVLLAALIAAFCGVLLGAPTLRLRGDYLAIVTLGFGEIIPIIFLNMDQYTRGTNGIAGIYPPATPCIGNFCINWNSSLNPTAYYYLILVLIAISIFANIRLRDSRIGRGWIAIREDEIAASSSGINLVNTKLLAFAAGAFFSGIAGVYHVAKLGAVNPNDFSSTDSFIFLAMVVIGGIGSIPGVIVGAVVVYALNVLVLPQLDSIALDPTSFLHFVNVLFPSFSFSSIRNLLFGLLLIVIMIFRPEGLIPSTRRRRELHTTQTNALEVSSLDEPPGSLEFEKEVHVE